MKYSGTKFAFELWKTTFQSLSNASSSPEFRKIENESSLWFDGKNPWAAQIAIRVPKLAYTLWNIASHFFVSLAPHCCCDSRCRGVKIQFREVVALIILHEGFRQIIRQFLFWWMDVALFPPC